jgi:hypothetical protein
MARSGQETLLKHETTEKLLDLKWRFIPRIAFYSNLLIYVVFLILFTVYSLSIPKDLVDEDANNNKTTNDSEILIEKNGLEINSQETNSAMQNLLIIVIVFNLIKKGLQVLLVDHLSFFGSLQNNGEVASYLLALASIFATSTEKKLNYASIAVLLSFIIFSLLTQKLRMFGLYVLAFRRTIQNSTKLLPIFFFIFAGFNLSFNIRTYFDVSYFNTTTGMSMVRTLSMALGGLESDEMGLDTPFVLNYIIYFLFIGLVCIITFNLFVGKKVFK